MPSGRASTSTDARHDLRAAALRLFHENGYPTTTVQQVVETAGVTKGAFYYYFQSKEQLLKDLHDEFLDDELQRAHRVVALGLPPDETLRRLVTELMLSVEQHQDAISVFLREHRFLSPAVAAQVKAKRDEFERIVTDTIEQGISDGVFAPVTSARLLCFGIMGMCAWAHEWFRPNAGLTAREVATMYADVLLGGLRA